MNLSLTLEEKEEKKRNRGREREEKENNQIGNKKILGSCVRNGILHLNLYTSPSL